MLRGYLDLIASLIVSAAVFVLVPFICRHFVAVIILLTAAGFAVALFTPAGDEIGTRIWR